LEKEKNMKKRGLGRSGITVSPLALGGNIFGWTVNEPTAFKILDAFVGAGFDLIDTADVYPRWVPGNRGGESETIIGNWMKRRGNRQKVVIATKVGSEMGPGMRGLSRVHILSAVEDSLRRLKTDHIDLYQSHQDDPVVPIQETLGAYEQLIKEGKVRAIGASNFAAKRLSRSLAISEEKGLPRYESLQPLYNLYDRAEFERTLAPLCREQGIGVISYYGLASGFLTGKYRSAEDLSKSVRGSRVKAYMTERGFRILAALDQVAARYEAAPASIALAWIMAQPGITAPIASATSVEQVKTLAVATRLKLDRKDMELLDNASSEPVVEKETKTAA
jgi:aryl-alcohol dehydrogenase-like predicted oxidoreductase